MKSLPNITTEDCYDSGAVYYREPNLPTSDERKTYTKRTQIEILLRWGAHFPSLFLFSHAQPSLFRIHITAVYPDSQMQMRSC